MKPVSSLHSSDITTLLNHLYHDAKSRRKEFNETVCLKNTTSDKENHFTLLQHQYMQVDRNFGQLLYNLVRTTKPSTVVEFGTSFGISTIFLAAALEDNQHGNIITTEFIAHKANTAQENLKAANLIERVDFRVGDALVSLKSDIPESIEFIFLDGEKSMYLDILKLLEPNLSTGCMIVADNTDHQGAQTFLEYVRNPSNGYMSSGIVSFGERQHGSGHEITMKL